MARHLRGAPPSHAPESGSPNPGGKTAASSGYSLSRTFTVETPVGPGVGGGTPSSQSPGVGCHRPRGSRVSTGVFVVKR